jgi:hypothetical protein
MGLGLVALPVPRPDRPWHCEPRHRQTRTTVSACAASVASSFGGHIGSSVTGPIGSVGANGDTRGDIATSRAPSSRSVPAIASRRCSASMRREIFAAPLVTTFHPVQDTVAVTPPGTTATFSSLAGVRPTTLRARSAAGLVNGYVDFAGFWPDRFRIFRPFASIGVSRNTLSSAPDPLVSTIVWSVGLGTGIRVTDSVMIGLADKYVDLGRAQGKSSSTSTTPSRALPKPSRPRRSSSISAPTSSPRASTAVSERLLGLAAARFPLMHSA